jgi:hypothetical protein
VRSKLATAFVAAAAFASMCTLVACGQTAKEDPVEEQIRQREAQRPEQTQPAEVEQTNRTIGEDIEG